MSVTVKDEWETSFFHTGEYPVATFFQTMSPIEGMSAGIVSPPHQAGFTFFWAAAHSNWERKGSKTHKRDSHHSAENHFREELTQLLLFKKSVKSLDNASPPTPQSK